MEHGTQYFLPLLINIIRYFLFAGIPFLIFYILFPTAFSKNKIQARIAKKKDFLREILHSVQTTFILAGVTLLMLKTPLREYTRVYYDVSDFSWWWIPLSFFLAMIVHDTYFYWMHRAAHHPLVFKQIHLLHHKSINPSPWASYSFQFTEGVLEALAIPIILMLIPMHPIALILFGMAGFVFNVYGHLGYEIAPKWLRHSFLFEFVNTSTHHNLHHAKFKGNYGLYFRVWDRIMGTEYPDYVEEYDKIQVRRFGNYPSSGSAWRSVFSVGLLMIIGLGTMSVKSRDTNSIEGKWKDEKEGGIILIYEKEGRYFGQLIGADDAEENRKIQEHGEIVLMKNFEKQSETEYCCGSIFQPREKRTVSATLILEDPNTLKINGKYRMFTGTRIWKRL